MKSFPQKMTTRVRWVCPFNRSRSPGIREGPDWRGARLRIQVLWGSVAFRFCTQFFLSFSLSLSQRESGSYLHRSFRAKQSGLYLQILHQRAGAEGTILRKGSISKQKMFLFPWGAENISMCMFSHVYDFKATILNDHFVKIIIVRASNELSLT
jgi:hypothetical protein